MGQRSHGGKNTTRTTDPLAITTCVTADIRYLIAALLSGAGHGIWSRNSVGRSTEGWLPTRLFMHTQVGKQMVTSARRMHLVAVSRRLFCIGIQLRMLKKWSGAIWTYSTKNHRSSLVVVVYQSRKRAFFSIIFVVHSFIHYY
jgi:hypothetical protein